MSAFKVVAFAFAAAWCLTTSAFAADGWTVRKTSGEVWTGQGAQPVSLGQDTVLKPGDTVTTGRNGRVLLVRGQETILISPNSVVGIPTEKKDGLATTITQQAGSILLEVEKKNVPHFEVETPYLAAVVKGTQFRVSVTATGTRVEVQRGQVEVVDFKTGQIAQVLPGQAAQSRTARRVFRSPGRAHSQPIERGSNARADAERSRCQVRHQDTADDGARQDTSRARAHTASRRAHARVPPSRCGADFRADRRGAAQRPQSHPRPGAQHEHGRRRRDRRASGQATTILERLGRPIRHDHEQSASAANTRAAVPAEMAETAETVAPAHRVRAA